MDNGDLFPFLHSTDVYPEMPVSALPHVNKEVAEEVLEALLAFGKHEELGQALEKCYTAFPGSDYCDGLPFPQAFDPKARCDSTKELSLLALESGRNAHLAGFRPARSYFSLRAMLERAGLLEQDSKGHW